MGLSLSYPDASGVMQDEPLASNTGWSEFGHWAAKLSTKQYVQIKMLYAHGMADDVPLFIEQLRRALVRNAPTDHTVHDTAEQLLETARIASGSGADYLAVTNGMVADDPNEPDEVDEEAPNFDSPSAQVEEHGPAPYPGAVFDEAAHRWKVPHYSSTAPATAPAIEPDHAGHVSQSLGSLVHAAEPEASRERNSGLMEWVKRKAITAAAKTHLHLKRLTPAMLKAMDALGMYLDTPNDIRKWFGYNPATSASTAGAHAARGADPVYAATSEIDPALGVSSHLAATVASHVLAAGITWVKRKLARTASEGMEAGDLQAFSEIMALTLADLAHEFGLTPPPDAKAIHAHLQSMGV